MRGFRWTILQPRVCEFSHNLEKIIQTVLGGRTPRLEESLSEPIFKEATVTSPDSKEDLTLGGGGAAIVGAVMNTSSSSSAGRGLGKVFVNCELK